MLELSGVTKRFGRSTAVSDLSLSVAAGQFVGVIGRSGAGKSTTLRMINRLAEPSASPGAGWMPPRPGAGRCAGGGSAAR